MLTAGSISLSDSLVDFFNQTGFAGATWGNIAMILVAFLLLYLAIKHKFEPLLLFTIAFGMLLTTCRERICSIPNCSPADISTGEASFRMPDCSIIFIWV